MDILAPAPVENHILAAVPLIIGVHPTVIAQRAGDEAYDAVLQRGGSGYDAAVAYHLAVRAVYDRYGYERCPCDLCTPADPEPGVENPANHAAELMGW